MAEEEKDYDEDALKQLKGKLVGTAGTKGSREQWELNEFIERFNDDWKKTPLESFAEKLGKSSVKRLLKWDKLADKITVTRDQRSGQYTIVAKVTEKNEVNMHLIDGTIAAKQGRAKKNVRSGRQTEAGGQRGGSGKIWERHRDVSRARQAAPVCYNRSFNVQRPYPNQQFIRSSMPPTHVPRQMSFHSGYEPRVAHRPQVYTAKPNAFLTGGNTASMGTRVKAVTVPQRPAEFCKSSAAGIQRPLPPTYAQMAAATPVEFCKSAPNIQVPPPGHRVFITRSPPPGFQHRQPEAFTRWTMANAPPPGYPPGYPPGFTQQRLVQRFNGVPAGEFPANAVSPNTKRLATEKLRQAVKTRVECSELQATPKSTETLMAPQVQCEGDRQAEESRCNTDFNSEEDADVPWAPKAQYFSLDELYADVAKVTARFEKIKLEAKESETNSELPPRLTDER